MDHKKVTESLDACLLTSEQLKKGFDFWCQYGDKFEDDLDGQKMIEG